MRAEHFDRLSVNGGMDLFTAPLSQVKNKKYHHIPFILSLSKDVHPEPVEGRSS